jgi:hypothetical protein
MPDDALQVARADNDTAAANGAGRVRAFDQFGAETFVEIIKSNEGETGKPSSAVPIDRLYVGNIGRGRLILRARGILQSGAVRLSQAQILLAQNDRVGADYEITLFQGDIPELFCCYSLSDGFGAVVAALYHALKNRRGDGLTVDQLTAVQSCVIRLENEPFFAYESALDLIDALDDAGLRTDPIIADALGEVLLDESNS